MNLNRKYAALPDLDSAPDIYETPSLTDDNSTAPDGTHRSGSASSHYTDFDSPPGTPSGSPQISRARLHPDTARSRFEPSLVDAKDVDFSDRISGKKKSYRASSRRVRVLADGTREMGDLSDEEEGGEGLERKMARLRREVEEVRVQVEARRREREGKADEDEEEDEAVGLSRLLEELARPAKGAEGTGDRLAKALSKPLAPAAETTQPPTEKPTDAAAPATYTVSYAPSYDSTHTLARITTFDTRLASLESALGLPPSGSGALHPVLPALTTLSQKLSVIGSATPSSIDALSRRVRALTAETEKMTAVKEAARAATPGGEGEKDEDEQAAKINALFGTLATIEGLAPLLPGVLERMRSLRKVHADAAGAQGEMEEALRKQEEMGREIEKWKVGLERVEQAVKEGERVGGENVKTVEGWVRELEERVKQLD
ncbi:hypothetical protein V494_05303 [Pseudogymnoascus sp. VKM F-4513 (FW-928)]|nr:hypothetical protein V494_05303 [Pseudogymnoascus sp. VKM F-4513 (FW-928)]